MFAWRWISDFVCVLRRTLFLERLRVSVGPKSAVSAARRLGQKSRWRSERDRHDLHRVISLVDRYWRGGPNCYRRVLIEVAMDRGAASEIVQFGFRSSGGMGSGHAWLGSEIGLDGSDEAYDAIVSI